MKIIVGNWKMNGDTELSKMFVERLNKIETENEVVLCPPTELLMQFGSFKHKLGAQNCCYMDDGAFTGETSAKALARIGCKYVILGHSERRYLFGEDNEMIYYKWSCARRNGITPIICVGERDDMSCADALARQLGVFTNEDVSGTIVAYEPVKSIGTGKPPSLEDINLSQRFIKKILTGDVKSLYGGSVNPTNYKDILSLPYVDGVLVGGASLKIDDFETIIQFQEEKGPFMKHYEMDLTKIRKRLFS